MTGKIREGMRDNSDQFCLCFFLLVCWNPDILISLAQIKRQVDVNDMVIATMIKD